MISYPRFLRRLGWKRGILFGDYCRFREVGLVVRALRGHAARRVLDIGSSGTVFPHYLAALFPEAQITGVDNEANIRLEVDRLAEAGARLGVGERVRLFTADARAMAFSDATFDAVTCISTIEHIPEDGDIEAIAEMARVVKRGGLIVLTLPMWEIHIELGHTAATPYFERKYTGPVLRERILSHPDLEVVELVAFQQRLWAYSETHMRLRRLQDRLMVCGAAWRPVRWLLWLALSLTPLASRVFIRHWRVRRDADFEKAGGAVVALRRRDSG